MSRIELVPTRGLVRDGQAGHWLATDDDPQFGLTLPRRLRGGWVELQLEIFSVDGWRSCPVLYLDCGTGFSELTAVRLPPPAPGQGMIKLVFPVPAAARAARFDPLAQPGRFGMGELRLRRLTKVGVATRMLLHIARRIGVRAVLRQVVQRLSSVSQSSRVRSFSDWLVREYRAAPSENSRSYKEWLVRFDARSARSGVNLNSLPKVSVLMAVTAADRRLERSLASLHAQSHQDWELCLALSTAVSAQVSFADEPRIVPVSSSASMARDMGALLQAAAQKASGSLVVKLQPSDALHPFALEFIAQRALDRPDAQLFFSDEDRLDDSGDRCEPEFKPDFNYELLLADWRAVGDICAVRAPLLRELGGLRPEFDVEAWFDLTLRAVESCGAKSVEHVAHVLYHRDLDAAADADSPRRTDLRRLAVTDHLRRRGLDASVELSGELACLLRVRHPLPSELPLVSVVIPTRDRADLLRLCTDSLRERSHYTKIEVIVVDNNSTELETIALLHELARRGVRVLRDPSPFNFAGLNNRAAQKARGEVLVLMNNDIEILTPDWVEEMLSFALQPDVGAVGARLWYPDGGLQHAGVFLGLGGVAGHGHKHLRRGEQGYARRALVHQQLSAVTAAVLMVRRATFEEVGGMDEQFEVAFNDVDLCLRLVQRGYRNVWTPYAEMVHHESASRGAETTPAKRERFNREIQLMQQRWGPLLECDPAYSPNLTLEAEDFSLAWPPRRHVSALRSRGSAVLMGDHRSNP